MYDAPAAARTTAPTASSAKPPQYPLPHCKHKFTWPSTPRIRAKGEEQMDDHRFKRLVISELNGHASGMHCLPHCNCFNAQKWVERRWSGKDYRTVCRVYDAVHDCD